MSDSTIEIGRMSIAPRSYVRGALWAGPYFYPPQNAKIRKNIGIPFTVIRGKEDGHTLCITAGVHPTEYAGIDSVIKISNEVDPENLRGTLICVPCVNIPGFNEREYVNPIDGLNLQGNWPGKPEIEGGTISHLILHQVFSEIVKKSDYYIDLHGMDVHETLAHCYCAFYRTGVNKFDEISENFARATGIRHINPSGPGGRTGSSVRVASDNGIHAIAIECGQGDVMLPRDVDTFFQAYINVMKHLKMIEGEPTPVKDHKYKKKGLMVRVRHEGLFYPAFKMGEHILKGQVLGEVRNLYGDVVETVYAPIEGTVNYWLHNPKLEAGQDLLELVVYE